VPWILRSKFGVEKKDIIDDFAAAVEGRRRVIGWPSHPFLYGPGIITIEQTYFEPGGSLNRDHHQARFSHG